LFVFLKLLRGFLIKYESWLVEPLDVLTLRFDTIEGDLHKLKHHCESLQLAIGRPLTIDGDAFSDVWSALEYVTSSANSAPETSNQVTQIILALQNEVSRIAKVCGDAGMLHDTVKKLKQTCTTFDARFTHIHPFLTAIKDLRVKIEKLDSAVATLSTTTANHLPRQSSTPPVQDPWLASFAPIPGMSTSPPRAPTSSSCTFGHGSARDSEARISSIEHQLRSLEKGLVGDGIRVGRFLFQSRED
jgi:hypothetical protein